MLGLRQGSALTLTLTLTLTHTLTLTLTLTLILTLTKELNSRISFYLDLVSEGRTKGHEPQAYLREDGDIWQRYEALLRREGLLDFDSMLVVFRTMLESHEDVRARFHRRYTHLVVDEFQDNSGLQTRLLQLMVCAEAPQLTVVCAAHLGRV